MIRKKHEVLLCCLTLLAVATAAGPARAAGEDALLPVGAVAPAVEGKDASGALVRLSAQKGHFAVVYFYPKDETPGCTKEACAFRDASDQFGKAGVTVFGVSRDPESSHQAFREKHALKFPLVADPTGAVQRAYHVPAVAPGAAVAARVTFLVGPDGKIARVWPKVDPVVNATEVLDAVASLGGKGPGAGAKEKEK
jgi:peroxiredoxin Q/BCP